MGTPILVLVVALYSAVATAYLEARRHREPPPAWARWVGPIAVVAHLVGLIALSHTIGRSPFATPSQSLSFLSFSLAGLYLVLEATSRVATHGGAFYATAALLAGVGVPGLIGSMAAETPRDALRTFHVGLSLMGTAAVLAGGLLAGGYLGQYRRVKHGAIRESGADGPSLRGFERLARRASVLGVLLLGPALGLGIAITTGETPPPGSAVLTGLTALVFALVLVAAWIWWRRPRHGRLAAWLNLTSLVVVLLTLLVVHPVVWPGN
jgi:ABC-type uncharacterized transport system permease subunit